MGSDFTVLLHYFTLFLSQTFNLHQVVRMKPSRQAVYFYLQRGTIIGSISGNLLRSLGVPVNELASFQEKCSRLKINKFVYPEHTE